LILFPIFRELTERKRKEAAEEERKRKEAAEEERKRKEAEEEERKRKADEEKKERNRKEIENLFRSGESKLKESNYDDAVAFFKKALDLDAEISSDFQTESRLTLASMRVFIIS